MRGLGVMMAALALLAATTAAADQRLTGADIRSMLTDAWVSYENARQQFLADGTTRYFAPDESLGFWSVEGDQYCSRWPPSGGWTCYDMFRTAEGTLIWIDSEGGRSRGTLEAK
ncbi:MAG: hypothetical protein AAF968_12205 [Pseudomonadota bacterium]